MRPPAPTLLPALLPTPASFSDVFAQARRTGEERRMRMAHPNRTQPLRARQTPPGESLHVVYVPPLGVANGGTRVLLEHGRQLTRLGHTVTYVSQWPEPTWAPVTGTWVHVPADRDLAEAIPPCDVVVAGYWTQIRELAARQPAPVAYFEQGDFHLFTDVDPATRTRVAGALTDADAVISVSPAASDALLSRYAVTADALAPPGVSPELITGSTNAALAAQVRTLGSYVLAVGGADFKRTKDVIAAVEQLRATSAPDLGLVWVSATPVAAPPWVATVINPEQGVLGALYGQAACVAMASEYESFSLVPLEAMACGTPAVITDIAGPAVYARHEENCLVVPVGDVPAIASAVARLLGDPELVASLTTVGTQTAAQYSWETVMVDVESLYRRLADRDRRADVTWEPDEALLASLEPASAAAPGPGVLAMLDWRMSAPHRPSHVMLPVSVEVIPGHGVARWEVAGRAAGAAKQQSGTCAWLPVRAARTTTARPWDAAVALLDTDPAAALDALDALPAGEHRGTVDRWRVVALLELGRDAQASELAESLFAGDPANLDFRYLRALASAVASGRRPATAAEDAQAARLLGPAGASPEWFADPTALIDTLLARYA